MGLIDSITKRLRSLRPASAGADTTDGEDTTRQTKVPARPAADLRRFTVERDRRAVVLDCRQMVEEDPRPKGALQTLARDVTRGGFSVDVTGGARPAAARKIAADFIERVGMTELAEEWVALSLRDGDTFLEIGVDGNDDIVSITRKPTLQMHRMSDDRDQFPDPTRAYWQGDEIWAGTEAPRDTIWFADWQILHGRWDRDPERRYGRPLFASARTAFKRVTGGELDIAVRRATRAGMIYLHQFPEGTQDEEIQAYIERNQEAIQNSDASTRDYFGTAKLNTIEGDARLGEIGDVQHHISTFALSSPIPLALLGYGENLNRDVLQEQKEQYDRALDGLTAWLDKEFLQPLVELQWLLKGIWPGSLTYEISRPSRHPLSAEALKAAGDAIKALKESGVVAEEILLDLLAQILPGIDPKTALEAIQQQREAQAPPPPPTSAMGTPPGTGDPNEENPKGPTTP